METSVEHVDETTVKLTITIEAPRVSRAIDDAAHRLSSEVKVPGFRPGRVPRRVLETRLGPGVLADEAAREALPAFYVEAARAEELAVVGRPDFAVDVFEYGKEARFTATVEVRPEIDVPDYQGLQVPHPDWEVTDEEVVEQLEALRDRFAELETVQRPVQVGDHVLASITGTQHDRKVEEASADDVLYEVRDPEQTDSELDRQLVGATPGAILRFNDTLSADYGELAGEELSFTTIVKEVKTKRLPDLDDDFAVTASEFDTLEELRAEIRQQLEGAKVEHAREALRGRVVETVVELVEVPLPESMVGEEVRFRLGQIAQQAESAGLQLDQFLQQAGMDLEQLTSHIQEDARRTVKAQLVVDTIGRDAGIEVLREDLEAEIRRQAARLNAPPDEVARLLTQSEHLPALVSDAARRKTIDHLVDSVQVLGGPPPPETSPETPPETPDDASSDAPAGDTRPTGDDADDADDETPSEEDTPAAAGE